MKPDLVRLRRALATAVTAMLLAAGIVVLSPALTASAHDKGITASCATGLSVSLTNYPRGSTVKVVIDGAVKTSGAEAFAPGWSAHYGWDSTVDHSYTVAVVSPDDPINPATLQGAKGWTFTTSASVLGCPPPDSPVITITGKSCANQSASNGSITFSLAGVTKQYTVTLLSGGVTKASTTSSGGVGSFSNLQAGNYTIKASALGGPTTFAEVTVILCTQEVPNINLTVQGCIRDGSLGAVTATLSNLVAGDDYTLQLFSGADVLLSTQTIAATGDSGQLTFAAQGPGTYYVTVSETGSGNLMTTSSNTTIENCRVAPTIAIRSEPCDVEPALAGVAGRAAAAPSAPSPQALAAPQAAVSTARQISTQVSGLRPFTAYTVELVSIDPIETVITSVAIPLGADTTYTHTFIEVPTPGEYIVRLLGGDAPLDSAPVAEPRCVTIPTLAPPTIEASVSQCGSVDPAAGALSARLGDLDATKTYYVRIVDNAGTVVDGGGDQQVTGVTTARVTFPGITSPGTYTAQLMIDPGKQLAATDPNTITVTRCLTTLAMTGFGELIPLIGIAALFLTMGGVVVTGRLRRRMAQ